ncbi:hypothetical protein F5Y02DRAFT_379525 [Annulohypoxylon stygium]|nr:hypothetical protein F5Y02DRAFT_379525 [Annulohypoxylon stygium]
MDIGSLLLIALELMADGSWNVQDRWTVALQCVDQWNPTRRQTNQLDSQEPGFFIHLKLLNSSRLRELLSQKNIRHQQP